MPFRIKDQIPLLIFLGLSIVIVLILFRASFDEGMVLFSSDGPLSTLVTAHNQVPEGFSGKWQDIYKLGKPSGAAPLNLTWILLWATTPEFFAKFYIPICLIVLSISIWCYCRSIGLSPLVSGLAGIVGLLNSNFFSYGAWGLGTIVLSAAFVFFALSTWRLRKQWGNVPASLVTGLCLGLCVMEGFDVGILLCILFAITVIWDLFDTEKKKTEKRTSLVSLNPDWKKSVLWFGIATLFSMFVAMQTVSSLFSTQVQGVAVLEENNSNQSKWDWATQWSLPISETIRLVVPGYFGYRMDTTDGGVYRGNVGRDRLFGTDNVPRLARHSGSGFYIGTFVFTVAFLTILLSIKNPGSLLNHQEVHWIRFWGIIILLSIGFSYGRHFILYGIIHPLPFFNSIRNPIKFLHPMTIGLFVVFAIGLNALVREYFSKKEKTPSLGKIGNLVLWGVPGVVVFLILAKASSRAGFEKYLTDTLVPEGVPMEIIQKIPGFVISELVTFLIFACLSSGLLIMLSRGLFKARMTVFFALAFCLVVVDLSKANLPWIKHFNAGVRYEEDAMVKKLRSVAEGAQSRVAFPHIYASASDQMNNIFVAYQQWMQHQFAYYNINSIDIPQESRPEIDYNKFRSSILASGPSNLTRFWQLTSSKYIFGLAQGYAEAFNKNFDPELSRYKPFYSFNFNMDKYREYNVLHTVESEQGPYSILEFEGALPRVNIYDRWEIEPSDDATLAKLADPKWDPFQSVIVNSPAPKPNTEVVETKSSSSWEVVTYSPREMKVEIEIQKPSILMTTDKFDSTWKVSVDESEAKLLRCNYIFRGVYLEPGKHRVRFSYQPSNFPLKISAASLCVGILSIFLPIIIKKKKKSKDSSH